MPKDSEGSTGSSYIVDEKNRKVLIPIDVNKIEDIKKVLGTLTEEVAHGKDALEGRQDKKVAEDKSNDEEGLETLGRPANEYVKKRFGEDNNSKIKLTTDGIDLSNADVGEKVGDSKGIAKIKGLAMGPNGTFGFLSRNKKISENMNETPTVYNYINGEAMVKIFEGQENVINKILIEENYDISSEKVHEELRKMATIGGTGHNYSSYEGIYVIDDPNLRKKFIDKDNNLHLALFDPPGWNKIEKSENYKNAVNNLKQKAIKYYEENKLKSKKEIEKKRSVSETVKFAGLFDTDKSETEYALGNSTILGSIVMRRGKPYLKYNLSDEFRDITGLNKGPLEIEWGQPYEMIGPVKMVPLYDKK